jgi:hypothetical protein
MPQNESRRIALSIVEKAAPCRYHQPFAGWRAAVAEPKRLSISRERHQTPIPSLKPADRPGTKY